MSSDAGEQEYDGCGWNGGAVREDSTYSTYISQGNQSGASSPTEHRHHLPDSYTPQTPSQESRVGCRDRSNLWLTDQDRSKRRPFGYKKASKACDPCRRAKERCQTTVDGNTICDRCTRTKRSCSFATTASPSSSEAVADGGAVGSGTTDDPSIDASSWIDEFIEDSATTQ